MLPKKLTIRSWAIWVGNKKYSDRFSGQKKWQESYKFDSTSSFRIKKSWKGFGLQGDLFLYFWSWENCLVIDQSCEQKIIKSNIWENVDQYKGQFLFNNENKYWSMMEANMDQWWNIDVWCMGFQLAAWEHHKGLWLNAKCIETLFCLSRKNSF